MSYRLAQQPGSYVVLKYTAPGRQAPQHRDPSHRRGAGERAGAFGRRCELPRRDAGRQVLLASPCLSPASTSSRRRHHAQPSPSLIHWASRAIDLLAPVTEAQSAQVLASDVLAMDETSLKAGREAKGKMRTGWLWLRCTAMPMRWCSTHAQLARAPSRACTFSATSAARCSATATTGTRPMPIATPRRGDPRAVLEPYSATL